MKDHEKLIERLSNLVTHWTKKAEENDNTRLNEYFRGHADAARDTLEWLDQRDLGPALGLTSSMPPRGGDWDTLCEITGGDSPSAYECRTWEDAFRNVIDSEAPLGVHMPAL